MDSALEYCWNGYRKWLGQYIPKETRRKFILGVSFFGVFLAGFLAWRDEHIKVEELSTRAVKLQVLLEERGESALRKELDVAQTQVATLQQEMVDLKERISPRRIEKEQKRSMVKQLSLSGSHELKIFYLMGDNEALTYAQDFRIVLTDAGWKVKDVVPVMIDRPMHGVFLQVKDKPSAPVEVDILNRVLKQHGIAVYGMEDSRMELNTVALFVGSK